MIRNRSSARLQVKRVVVLLIDERLYDVAAVMISLVAIQLAHSPIRP